MTQFHDKGFFHRVAGFSEAQAFHRNLGLQELFGKPLKRRNVMFCREKHSRVLLAVLWPLLLLSLACLPVLAESDLDASPETKAVTDSESETGASVETSAQSAGADVSPALSKLQVHGFLSQAWADAKFQKVEVGELPPPPFGPGGIGPLGSSPEGNEISIGIPEDGTTNYRFLALQFRYDISLKDVFVVQFSSRTLGFSPLQDFEDEIELDWAFYERRIGDDTSLKVGRVQIPFGIYNEIRDVGTLLPFYRPPFVFYKEGSFTSETVDGLAISHNFFSESDWNLDFNAYAGEWESIQLYPTDPSLSNIVNAKDGYGFQAWLNTPLSSNGVRLGVGLLSFEEEETDFPLRALARRDLWTGSIDANIGRFTFQTEHSIEVSDIFFSGLTQEIESYSGYFLVGFAATDSIRLWAQYEESGFELRTDLFTKPADNTSREDLGLSFNYFFNPQIVLKAEHHWVDGEGFNVYPDFSTGEFRLRPQNFSYSDGSYSIVTLSVAF